MRKYIEIIIGGKSYRFLIDKELDKTLKSSLKERYKFDASDTLIIDEDDLVNSYNLKQLILKALLNQINTYDLSPDLQQKIDSLKNYIGNRTSVYGSDLSRLDEVLGEASEIYGSISANLPKKEIADTQRETIKDSISEVKEKIDNLELLDDSISDTVSSTDDKLEEFKTIIEEISFDEELKDKVPVSTIKDAMNRVVICSSMEEFIEKTRSNVGSYDIVNAIKSKSEKIVLPPNSKLEDVTVEILKTCVSDNTVMEKILTYVERKAIYKSKTDSAFESLRSSLKVSGLSARNLNYFGDQFFNSFEAVCRESGMSFEAMFADYFNTYSANRKYNSPMDKFIRLFNKYNGGDDNTRALLEAMLVKKAISRGLISRKYNNYLKDEYRNLNVNSNGYINFNENIFNSVSGGVNGAEAHLVNIASEGHLDTNISAPEKDGNIKNSISEMDEGNDNIVNTNIINNANIDSNLNNNSQRIMSDSALLNSSVQANRKNRLGAVDEVTKGGATTQSSVNSRNVSSIGGRRFTSNTSLNHSVISEEADVTTNDDDTLESEENLAAPASEVSDNNSPSYGGAISNDSNQDDNTESDSGNNIWTSPLSNAADSIEDIAKKGAKKAIIEFIKKNPWTWGVIGVLIFLLFVFLIIMASNEDKNNGLGYYDSVCNFNDANVTITSCETNSDIQTLDLKDYVVRMAYLYTKEGNYSDETIKALMIILKTNALSLGGYSSGNKNVSVRICDVYSNTVNENDLFVGIDERLENLNTLYEQISEYLFISSSYKSSITSLGGANAITINDTILANLESAAATSSSYAEILDTVFKVENEENITISDARENLFLGDSRTQGMLLTSVINENNTVYGVGYGYSWLTGNGNFTGTTNSSNGGISGINSKMVNGKLYNIIIWLGVNDLDSVNYYLEKYIELASGEWSSHNIYIVSVGPVLDSKSQYVKNENINKFNDTMKDGINKANLSNLKYIDLGYTESSIKSYDNAGIHYSSEDYRNIYSKMASNIISGPSSISTKLALYKLSDYCTYYTLTENDAYWWPIGSKESTQGNIYGGTPISTLITSPFGMRIHPKTGQYKLHTGIDIAGVNTESPVIATKSGTVISVKNNCTKESCTCSTGGYGNNVKIDHGDGVVSLYAHLSSTSVEVGDTVSQGQKIGMAGTTGCSTGYHLHFEIQLNGVQVNPVDYVKADNPRPTNSLSPNVTGIDGDSKNMVCSSLLASGFSKEATIGIMANLFAESGYSTINLQNSYESKLGYNDSSYTLAVDKGTYKNFVNDSAGYGLVQWTSAGRKQNLYNYAKEKNVSIGNFEMQFTFMLKELENSYSKTYKYITGGHNAVETGAYWCDHYESPGGSEPCIYNGNCPSQYCVNRTKNSIASDKIADYVNNGCKY